MTDEQCWAGRKAFASGRWAQILPCIRFGRHVLAFSVELGGPAVAGAPVMRFCDEHCAELIAMGLIEEPMVGEDEWERRTS